MQGINLDALRSAGEQKGKNYKTGLFWTPPEGNSVVRIVPYVHREGNPFTTLQIHFNLIPDSKVPVLSPKTFGEKDPVFEFGMKIREQGTPEAKEEAKQFFPATKVYAPVIVRGKESEGIKFWAMSKTNFEDLTNLILNGGAGDIADLNTGRDILINHSKVSGRTAGVIRVVTAPNPSVATEDQTLLNSIKEVPVVEEIYERNSQEKMMEFLKVKRDYVLKQREAKKNQQVQSNPSVGKYDLDSLMADY